MSKRPSVTLCMIVKNEEHIICECLESIAPHIDRYDISDTGSTDGTIKVIKDFFEDKGIPGEVHEIPWGLVRVEQSHLIMPLRVVQNTHGLLTLTIDFKETSSTQKK